MLGTNRNSGFHKEAETLPQVVLESRFPPPPKKCTAPIIRKTLWLEHLVKAKPCN